MPVPQPYTVDRHVPVPYPVHVQQQAVAVHAAPAVAIQHHHHEPAIAIQHQPALALHAAPAAYAAPIADHGHFAESSAFLAGAPALDLHQHHHDAHAYHF